MNALKSTNRKLLFTISKRFKKKKHKPPRDPKPASSFMKQNVDPSFDPFVSATDFKSDANRSGWTKIDHRQSKTSSFAEENDDIMTTSPDILSEYSQPQVLPRTKGIKTIAKYVEEEPYRHQLPPQTKIEIVAEDDNYIFVHKPAGIAVHGTEEYEYSQNVDIMNIKQKRKRNKKSGKQKTFYELFMEHWWTTYPFFRFQPRLLQRLDKDVSGIMVFGKKWCAEEHFANLLHGNADYSYGCGVKKCYIAVCKGVPNKTEGLIEGLIRKAHWNYRRFAIYPNKGQKYVTKEARVDASDTDDHKYVDNKSVGNVGGSHVKTEFKVVDICEHGQIGVCSLIIFTIHTGKRHQIRASAAALGTPIIGDVVYGAPKYGTLLLHSLFVGFEGIIDTDIMYAVSCLPKWSHLSNHFWSTKAQYYTQKHVDFLMTVPRPSKKPRAIQYSMRKERAALKRSLERGRSHLLLPFTEQVVNMVDDAKQEHNLLSDTSEEEQKKEMYEKSRKQMELKYDKSGMDKMEDFVAKNFIEHTLASHIKEMDKNRKLKVFEKPSKTNDDHYDSLLDGAVPSHFMDDV